jgi:MFS family permease
MSASSSPPGSSAPPASTWSHLAHLLRGRWFRRLFAVRLSSQLSDGVFQVALASYALFDAEQPSPAAIAAALTVVLLPFSVLGPFAGVLLDRWSRRQVLAWSNFVRVGIVAVVAAVVAAGLPDPAFYAVVLVCLSVNRFLLAGLSAALPHTVAGRDLVTANALTPTAGTLAFVVGLTAGGAVRAAARGAGWDGDVTVLLLACVLYAVAGSLALRIPRDLLGPDLADAPPPVRDAVRSVVAGLVDGLRHLRARPSPAAALGVIGAQRYLVGIVTVALVLVFRNDLDRGDVDAAFGDLALTTLVGGAGFVVAALVTPAVVDRISPRRWILALLVVGAVAQLVPVAAVTLSSLLVTAFVLGLCSQGIKICVDTLVQTGVEDAFRGRVFSLYDVLFNVAFVAAAGTGALVLPLDGLSTGLLVTLALGHLAVAAAYSRVPVSGSSRPAP